MPAHVEKGDIRSVKIERALHKAMFSLLEKHNFRKITVRDICTESLISRATFYSRFTDKYDFLKWWIMTVWPADIVCKEDSYEIVEKKINRLINKNQSIIKNLFVDADNWTLDTLFEVVCSILHLTIDKTIDGAANPEYIVLSHIYIGGMIQYILWQVKNGFPQDVSTMNIYLYEVIKIFQQWS